MLTTAVVVAAVLAVVLTRAGSGTGKRGEVFLQAANSAGQDPFTESTAVKSSVTSESPAPSASVVSGAPANEVRGVSGAAPGLYSGTQNSGSCDVEQQIKYFQASPSRNRAFASQVGVQPSGVPAYLRSLTPVQLRADTRVTAHGYRDGGATTYQSVLQAGTAVMVDGHGVPRVRCACGNPLTPPVAQRTTPRTTGAAWPAYRPANVVVVAPAAQVVNVFVIFDHRHDDWFGRHRGDHTGHQDHRTRPPADPNPMYPPASTGPSRPSSPGTGSSPPSSPSSHSPSSKPPSANSHSPSSPPPSSKPPSSQPPSSMPPSSVPPSSQGPSVESPKTESPKSESPKTESPKTESPASESPATEPGPGSKSPEPLKPPESTKSPESPKSEVPRSEGPPSPASPGPESAVSSAAPESPVVPPGSAPASPPV